MRKSLFLYVLVTFIVWPFQNAVAANYVLDTSNNPAGFEVVTFNTSSSKTYLYFNVVDLEDNGFPIAHDVVTAVEIKEPGDADWREVSEDFSITSFPEYRATDANGDGAIDLASSTEWQERHHSVIEYGVQMPTSPHIAGDYYLRVTCDNAQVLTSSALAMPAGQDNTALPPMENFDVAFSGDNLVLSWSYPASGVAAYSGDASDATIDFRIELFRADGYKALRYRFRRFPVSLNKTGHVLYSWLSEIVQGYAYMRCKLKVADLTNESQSESNIKVFAINGTTLTESEIKERKNVAVIPLF